MHDFGRGIIVGSLIVAVFVAILFASVSPYKRGQIDYANGIIKYHLVKQPDGSTVWEEKNESHK